jgi:hypothetical protein
MTTDDFSGVIATLVTNGFHISKIERISSGNYLLDIYKIDLFGARVNYCMLFSEDSQPSAVIDTLISKSKRENSNPVLISDHLQNDNCANYSNKKFYDFFGGIVNTGLILIPTLPEILATLGHNKLPKNLEGDPDDLLEMYSKECLQFALSSPTRRYGKDRLFESLPDIVVLSKDKFMVVIDTKAYEKGYSIQADDIKRFASYVEDFENRYSSYCGHVYTFLVVSGHFEDGKRSLENRSNELYKLCKCKLSCIESKELAMIVQLLLSNNNIKGSINWKNILSDLIITKQLVISEINRIHKDKIY